MRGRLEGFASYFQLSASDIAGISQTVRRNASSSPSTDLFRELGKGMVREYIWEGPRIFKGVIFDKGLIHCSSVSFYWSLGFSR